MEFYFVHFGEGSGAFILKVRSVPSVGEIIYPRIQNMDWIASDNAALAHGDRFRITSRQPDVQYGEETIPSFGIVNARYNSL